MLTHPRSPRRSRSRRVARIAGTLCLAGALTACGGGDEEASGSDAIIVVDDAGADGAATADAADSAGSTESAGTSGGDDAAAPVDDEQAAMDFAACMRDEGVDDFPDPTVGADGSVDFGVGPGAGGDGGGADGGAFGDPDFQTAAEACMPLLEGASFLPDDADMTELEDNLLELAQCLRDQGLDVDDPDLGDLGGQGDGGAPPAEGANPFGAEFDPDDPAVAAAIEACQDVVGGIAPGGN